MRRILTAIILVALVVMPGRGLAQGIQEPAAEGFGRTPASDSTGGRVTITFSYYVNDLDAANRPESEASCSLTLPWGSNGVEVLRAAVNQDCIQSFSTVREDGFKWLDCINHWCADVTNSPGIVPDTTWTVDWTGDGGNWGDSDYARSGLKGYSASDGDSFTAGLYMVS